MPSSGLTSTTFPYPEWNDFGISGDHPLPFFNGGFPEVHDFVRVVGPVEHRVGDHSMTFGVQSGDHAVMIGKGNGDKAWLHSLHDHSIRTQEIHVWDLPIRFVEIIVTKSIVGDEHDQILHGFVRGMGSNEYGVDIE